MSKLKVDELEESTSGSNITVNTGSDLIVDDNIQLGHDSDTTLARASAGDISVEGNTVYRAGGTDVAVADGGTGAGTATAGFDALSPMTTAGDIMYGGSSGTVTRLAASTDGHVLTSTGAGSAPAWEAASGGAVKQVKHFFGKQSTSDHYSSEAVNFTSYTGSYWDGDTSPSISVTSGNTILVMANLSLGVYNGDADSCFQIRIYDETNTTERSDGATGLVSARYIYDTPEARGTNESNPYLLNSSTIFVSWTHNATETVTIVPQVRAGCGGTYVYNTDYTSMILMEIE